MDFEAIGGFEDGLLGSSEATGRKLFGPGFGSKRSGRVAGRQSDCEWSGRVSYIRADIGQDAAVVEHYGAPFDPFSGSELRRAATRDRNAPHMATVNVAAIGIE